MNRPICFVEFKSPNQPLSMKELAGGQFDKINEPEKTRNRENWAIYCSDRLVTGWNKKIRPKSKILMVRRDAEPVDLDVAFRSSDLIVLDKPVDLPTQQTLKTFEDNLFERVRLFLIQEKSFPQGLPYVGLHHRLDRGTSGLVLMTLQRSANKEVSELFKQRKIHKAYLALAEPGKVSPPKKWRQVDKIARGPAMKKNFYFRVSDEGDEAVTDFELINRIEGKSCEFRCYPKTGRTHQIRVQLAHKGYPILGDATYGRKKSAPRMMLHAQELRFQFKGSKMEIQSVKAQSFLSQRDFLSN